MEKIITTNIPRLISKQFNFTGKISDDICLAFENEVSFKEDERQLIIAKGIPLIGGVRFDKIQQSIILNRFKINHPVTFFNKQYRCINDIDELNSYVDLDQFVVKPIRGARGIGVKKITREEYKKCITTKNGVVEVFEKEKEFLKNNNNDISYSYIENNFNSMIIQEPIDIVKEFRLLLFAPYNFLVYERIRNKSEFCGNLSHGSKVGEVSNELREKYILPQFDKFYEIMKEFKYPFLSIDLYVDNKENVGCFEFQMEFTYEGFDYKKVREFMVESLKFYIK